MERSRRRARRSIQRLGLPISGAYSVRMVLNRLGAPVLVPKQEIGTSATGCRVFHGSLAASREISFGIPANVTSIRDIIEHHDVE